MLALLLACAPAAPPPLPPPAAAAPAAAAPAPAPAPAAAPEPPPAPAAAPARLDLNHASSEALGTVPNAGKRMVHEFEEYRPYSSILQFRKEMGKYVSAEEVAAFERYLYVPIDPERSDAATLRQISGLDEAESEALVKGRPYPSREAFLEKLGAALAPEELAAARALLVP